MPASFAIRLALGVNICQILIRPWALDSAYDAGQEEITMAAEDIYGPSIVSEARGMSVETLRPIVDGQYIRQIRVGSGLVDEITAWMVLGKNPQEGRKA